jgi:hypothetical protein
MILNLIQVHRPNTTSRPRFKPPLIKLLVMNRHDVRNAAPLFGARNNCESAICGRPSDVVVNESNAISV